MSFRDAVATVPSLAAHLELGLRALQGNHASMIECAPSRRLRGSVYLDPILGDRRSWDYSIGWACRSGPECVNFVEVHPANSLHIDTILAKKASVLDWLRREAASLAELARDTERTTERPVFHWLATESGIAIRPGSRQSRQLQAAGISGPVRRLTLH